MKHLACSKKFGGSEKSRFCSLKSLRPLATDTSCQLDVLRHDCHSLCVNGAQVGVLEETDQVGLACFLKCHDSRALKAKIGLEILCNFAYKALEGQFSDEKFSALLITTNLSQCDGARPVSMRLLYASSCWSTLSGCLGSQLFSGRLATSWFSCSLLSTCHRCSRNGDVLWISQANCASCIYSKERSRDHAVLQKYWPTRFHTLNSILLHISNNFPPNV